MRDHLAHIVFVLCRSYVSLQRLQHKSSFQQACVESRSTAAIFNKQSISADGKGSDLSGRGSADQRHVHWALQASPQEHESEGQAAHDEVIAFGSSSWCAQLMGPTHWAIGPAMNSTGKQQATCAACCLLVL